MSRGRLGFYSPFLTAAQKAALRQLEQALEEDDGAGIAAAMGTFLRLAFQVTREAVLEYWATLDLRTFEEIRDDDEDSDVADQLRQLLWNGDHLSPFADRLLLWSQGSPDEADLLMTVAELNNYLGASVDFYEGLRPLCPSGEVDLPVLSLREPPSPPSLELPAVVVEEGAALPSDLEPEPLTMIELNWAPRPEPALEMPPPIIKETPAILKLMWETGPLPEALPGELPPSAWGTWRSDLPSRELEEGESEDELKVLILGGPPELDWSTKKRQAPDKGDLELPLMPLLKPADEAAHEDDPDRCLLEPESVGLELVKDPEPEGGAEQVTLEPLASPPLPLLEGPADSEQTLELLQGPAYHDEDTSPEPLGDLPGAGLTLLFEASASPPEELPSEREELNLPPIEVGEQSGEQGVESEPELESESVSESESESESELECEQEQESVEVKVEGPQVAEELAGESGEDQAEEEPEPPRPEPVSARPAAAEKPSSPRESELDDGVELLGLSSAPLSPLEERSQLIVKKKYLGYGKNSDGVMGYCGQITLSRFDDAAVNAKLECSNPLLFLSPTTPSGKAPVVTYWMPPAAFPQPGGHLTIATPEQNKVLSVVSLFPQSRTDFLSASQVLLLLFTPSMLGLLYFCFVYLLSASGIVAQVKEIFPDAYAAAVAGSAVADFRSQGVGLYQLEVVPASESLQLIWAGLIWLCPLIAAKFFRHLSRSRQRELGAALAGSLVLPSIGLLLIWNAQKVSFPLFDHPDFAPLDLRNFLPWSVPLNLAIASYLFLSVHGVWDRRVRSGELRFLLPVVLALVYAAIAFLLIFGRSWLAQG